MYHDDPGIVRYCHGIARRRELVEEHIEKVCLVLPWNARSIMDTMDRHRGYPSQGESAGGQVKERLAPEKAWESCVTECNRLTQLKGGQESIRMFDGKQKLSLPAVRKRIPEKLLKVADRQAGEKEELERVASLPDCWVWISRDLLGLQHKEPLTIDSWIDEMARVVPQYWRGSREEQEKQDAVMLDALRNERIRIVTVSRARYNPRFRGRLIVTPSRARKMLVHIALCLSLSTSVANQKLESVFE
jgi:hypothetical protein